AEAGDGAEGVGPRPQVRLGAQELQRVALFLQRVALRVGRAVDGDAGGVDLGRLALGGGLADLPDDGDARAGGEVLDLAVVVGQPGVGDDLDVALAGAVVDLDEAEAALGVAARADPPLQLHLLADRALAARLGDADLLHDEPS